MIVSKVIVDELLSVLARRFARDREELARDAFFLNSVAETVDPDEEFAVLPDQPDNRILECALAGSTDAVMTGDRAMLALEEFRKVRFLSLAEYVA